MSDACLKVEITRQAVDIDDLGDDFSAAADEFTIYGDLVGRYLGAVVSDAGVGFASNWCGVIPRCARQVENRRIDRPLTLSQDYLDTFKRAA